MDIILDIVLFLIALLFTLVVSHRAWMECRWHLFGWRPRILNRAILDRTLEDYLRNNAAVEIERACRSSGLNATEDEKKEFIMHIKGHLRSAVERYLKKVALIN